jgi:uncharacterized protein YjbI with pentapeptide repeats
MADNGQVEMLHDSVDEWNRWRAANREIKPDLSRIDLAWAHLEGADLRDANLTWADLAGVRLTGAALTGATLIRANLADATLDSADLSAADLRGAFLNGAHLTQSILTQANLSEADLRRAKCVEADFGKALLLEANLGNADLQRANLTEANLGGANLSWAKLNSARLVKADLSGAELGVAKLLTAVFQTEHFGFRGADLSRADLTEADLSGANLSGVNLLETRLVNANLRGCIVYGISAWNVELEGAVQVDLCITPSDEPAVLVSDLEVAQFLYLMTDNQRLRSVIDTITSTVVLILGRFTPERKAVLDAVREALQQCGYVPVLFDFDRPSSRDATETITLLARMARFIIADITDPASVPHELQAIVPTLAVPVQPILAEGRHPYGMFSDNWKHDWVLPPRLYTSIDDLLASFQDTVIRPAETKWQELQARRNPRT